jgi:hypothetical protein
MKRNGVVFCLAVVLTFLIGAGGADALAAPKAPAGNDAASPFAVLAAKSTATTKATVGSVKDYFPFKPNTRYVYEGSGNEFASYDVFVDYTKGSKMQQRVDNGGTVLARVIEVKDGAAKLVYSRPEAYYRENFLSTKANKSEVLLKEPLRAGTKWKLSDGRERRIQSTSASVSTPSGDYKAVEVVTKSKDGSTTTDYYAKNVGLVKSVSGSISSSLSSIKKDTALVQTVRFYYPNMDADRVDFVDAQVRFRTNDITRIVLAQAYRDALAGKSSKVFSKNTKINSLYLNRDGMVYIDLNRAFVSEMNAGSGYESMILQSVANTFGGYYGVKRVLLTIDNKLYESGHIALKKGEYLKVDLG